MKYGISSLAWQSPFCEPVAQFEKAKKYGCDIYEITVEDFSTLDADEINHAKEITGIQTPTMCGSFGGTRNISSTNPDIRANGIQYMKDMIDLAVRIDTKVIVGPMYSGCGTARARTPEEKKQQWMLAVENLKIVADYAGERGIKLGVEPVNRFENDMINTVEQAIELVDLIGYENVGFLLDTFHLNIEEADMYAAIRSVKGRILDFHTCANNRGTPGEDNFNWKLISKAIKDAEYADYCVVESFTPECKDLAKAASVWRPFAKSPEYIVEKGLPFLKSVFE